MDQSLGSCNNTHSEGEGESPADTLTRTIPKSGDFILILLHGSSFLAPHYVI